MSGKILATIAENLRLSVGATARLRNVAAKVRADWIDAVLHQAELLLAAREKFGKDDRAFGQWLIEEEIEIGHNERSCSLWRASRLGRASFSRQVTAGAYAGSGRKPRKNKLDLSRFW